MSAWVEQIMGLPISIHTRGEAPAKIVERQVAQVFAELRHADEVFSPYRDDSQLSRWERGELAAADADPAFTEVLLWCDEARERTDGWFDARALPDPRTGRPRFDPSGLVKGWAVQRSARHLSKVDDLSWCLNAGGDVLVHSPAGQPPWRVGIEDPADPSRVLAIIERRGGAVATSGTTHRGSHIINPRTGTPADALRAVTVIGPDLMWADVFATAAVAQGLEALEQLDDLDGFEALAVEPSGVLRATMGLAAWGLAALQRQ